MKKKTIYIFIISLVAVFLICFGVFYMIKDSKKENKRTNEEKNPQVDFKVTSSYICNYDSYNEEKKFSINHIYEFSYKNDNNEFKVENGSYTVKYKFENMDSYNSIIGEPLHGAGKAQTEFDEKVLTKVFKYKIIMNSSVNTSLDDYINSLSQMNYKCEKAKY